MSTYPAPSPIEEKRPGFLHRPVPMWAFLLLVILIGLLVFLPAFLPLTPPASIRQPLVLTPDSRTFYIPGNKTMTENFTVANLNATSAITASASVTLAPTNPHVNATIYGVVTGTSFVLATDGGTLSFPPGGNTLIIHVISDLSGAGNYTVRVSLSS